MGQVLYSTKYRKNSGLAMSPEELLATYFYGIQLQSNDGTSLSMDTIRFHIQAAQSEVEKYLEIFLNLKLIDQTIDYYRDDYLNCLPIMKTKYPVKEALSLTGFLNGIEQIKYPKQWLNTKKDSEGHYFKKIHVIPVGALMGASNNWQSTAVLLSGITAYIGMTALADISNYFQVQYVTGFEAKNMPMDVVDLIGKYAAIRIFAIVGELVLGGGGISSISLGVDGLSQSLSSSKSASSSAYSARITQYTTEIKEYLSKLKMFYKSMNMTAL